MEIAIPAPDLVGHLEKRLLGEFALTAEEWSRCVSTLTRWEDDNLLETPTDESLRVHKATVQRLLEFGRFLSLVTGQASFSDRPTAEMVAATQSALQDKLRMWHKPRMSKTESDRILAACFPDES
jgi:hypothetical protein